MQDIYNMQFAGQRWKSNMKLGAVAVNKGSNQ